LPDMNAVLGIGQLARLQEMNQRRAELSGQYLKQLADVDELTPLHVPDYPMQHAWHLFVVRLDIDACGISRDDFIARLKTLGIGAGLHFRAVHGQKYYREQLPTAAGVLPNTEWNSERIFSLPLFPDMLDSDVVRVVEAIQTVLAGKD